MLKICVILIREGSIRLRGKNIKILGGKPLCFWTIDQALDSEIFDEIWISSDSDEYLSLCENYYRDLCKYIKRPDFVSLESSTTYDTLSFLFENSVYENFLFVNLQVTSPFRDTYDIINSLETYQKKGVDHLVSVVKSPYVKDLNMKVEDGLVVSDVKNNFETYYYPNGSIWISSKLAYLRDRTFYTKRTAIYEMDRFKSQDINDEYDFLLCELLCGRFFNN